MLHHQTVVLCFVEVAIAMTQQDHLLTLTHFADQFDYIVNCVYEAFFWYDLWKKSQVLGLFIESWGGNVTV